MNEWIKNIAGRLIKKYGNDVKISCKNIHIVESDDDSHNYALQADKCKASVSDYEFDFPKVTSYGNIDNLDNCDIHDSD